MDIEKFKKIVGPSVKKINDKQLYEASGSFRSLGELLIEWYERKLAEGDWPKKKEAKNMKRTNTNLNLSPEGGGIHG